MLKSLKIKNFRCFEEFDLPQLGRVNLLVGKNNSGKTSIRNACRNSKAVSNIPDELPEEGLIIEADNGVRVGIWIMPDNKHWFRELYQL